jgi:uncharacterized repeat protein (TIGR01451 family)
MVRHWLTEVFGRIDLDGTATAQPIQPRLHLMLHAVVRPGAAMATAETQIATAPGTQTLHLTGEGVDTWDGTVAHPEAVLSLVLPLELHAHGAPASPVQLGPGDPAASREADLLAVGVTSDYAGVMAETTVYFAVSTYGPWGSPNELTVEVLVDSDLDGIADRVVLNTDKGRYVGEEPNDVFLSVTCELPDRVVCNEYPPLNVHGAGLVDTEPFVTNVMVLSAPALALGLFNESARFDWSVRTFNAYGQRVDALPPMTFDPKTPCLEFGPSAGWFPPYFDDLAGGTLTFVTNGAACLGSGARGALLIHHHNAPGGPVRDQELPLVGPTPSADVWVTKTAAATPAPVGAVERYLIAVGNEGPDSAHAVLLTDQLPAGMQLAGVSGAMGVPDTCTLAGGTVSCSFGLLVAGAVKTLELDVRATAPGSLTNSASVSWAGIETDPTDNAASFTRTFFGAGDANGDGARDTGDVFNVINHLFAGGPEPLGSGDCNGDGTLSVADVFYLINHLFAGGPEPL